MLLILTSLILTSCSNENSKSTEKFLDISKGIWVDTASIKMLGDGSAYFSFCGFSDDGIFFGSYPGSYSRIGKITNVSKINEKEYAITLFYKAEEYFGEFFEESHEEYTLHFASDKCYFSDNGDFIYTYMGKDVESAALFVNEYVSKGLHLNLPKLNLSATYLGMDRATLKFKQDLYGPAHLNDYAEYWLFLKNIDSAIVYKNIDSGMHYGLIDNQVVFQGFVNTHLQIRDVISNASTVVEGKQYELSRDGGTSKFLAYLWKIDDGFLLISFYENSSLEFYQQTIHSVTIVSDLKYLNIPN